MKKTKFLIIHPSKRAFYGIDYVNSKFLQNILDKIGYKTIPFKEKLFLKSLHNFSTENILRKVLILFRVLLFVLRYKILKYNYVISFNAKTILNYGVIYKNNYFNIFSNLLNKETILKWDHINEQIPLIRKTFEGNYNIKKIYFNLRKNFYHFTNFNYPKKINFDKFNFNKLNGLNFYFILKYTKKRRYFKKKDLCLCGYLNSDINLNPEQHRLFNTLNFKQNYRFKLKTKNLGNLYYEFKKRRILQNLHSVDFVGKEQKNQKLLFKNINKNHNYADFLKKVSNEYKFVINPVNPINELKTFKLLSIFYFGGFCLEERSSSLQQFSFLNKFDRYIYYKNITDLKKKISILKKNVKLYNKIKDEIKVFAASIVENSEKKFLKKFK